VCPRSLSEAFTLQFYAWEQAGRGLLAFPEPVGLEPPFRPFEGFELPRVKDDGRRPNAVGTWLERLAGRERRVEAEEAGVEEELPPPWLSPEEPLVEWTVLVPANAPGGLAGAEGWLRALAGTRLPLSFELVGAEGQVSVHLATRESEAAFVAGQFRAFFPDATLLPEPGQLARAWQTGAGQDAALSFGLAREWMLPLPRSRSGEAEPLLSLFAVLSTLREGEVGVVQMLFETVVSEWAESARLALFGRSGKPLFADEPDFNRLAAEKLREPLVAVAIRVAARSPSDPWCVLGRLAQTLGAYAAPEWNEFVPVFEEEAEADLLSRQSRRTGMLLSLPELARFVHPPGSSVRLPAVRRRGLRSKPLPEEAMLPGVTLGTGSHDGLPFVAKLPLAARLRHTHVVGATGTGKSTLLLSLILQDIEAGRGVALLDPHGDLVDEVIARLPEERRGDVLLFDPADEACALSFNLLEAQSEREKDLLSSDLVAVFRRLSTSWGDQMTAVLSNAVLAFLESPQGGTLLDLRRFLLETPFRKGILESVADPYIRYFWEKEFSLLAGGKSVGPIATRLDSFLRSRLMRRVLAERRGELDLGEVVTSGKVLLCKLSEGAIGEENASLLGSLIVAKLNQVALGRQDTAAAARSPFFLYIDEAHHFATPSMASLLGGARKFGLGLVLSHQDLRQLDRVPEVASSLLSNAYTRIVFRTGEDDARKLERGFSFFAADDLQSLKVGEAVCRLGSADADFRVATPEIPAASLERAARNREELRGRMRLLRRQPEDSPPAAHPPTNPILPPPVSTPQSASVPPARSRAMPAPAPATLGRGGPEHKYLQELVRRSAEARGYRAMVEKDLDGQGSVDVAIQGEDWSLGCEISVSSTPEQEAGNVEKCLAAGFSQVVVLSLKKAHLGEIEGAVKKRLAADDVSRVLFMTPEELLTFLDGRPMVAREETVGGYRVKVNYRAAPEEERRKAVAGVIGRSLRRLI
jgi:hypothetical protein